MNFVFGRVHHQRRQYQLYQKNDPKCTLTEERVKELRDAGFLFSYNWDERYEELKLFKAKHGHTVVPQTYPQLGWWVNTQRRVCF